MTPSGSVTTGLCWPGRKGTVAFTTVPHRDDPAACDAVGTVNVCGRF